MTTRRIAYTGRKRINHSDIDIVVPESQTGPWSFTVTLKNLESYRLPGTASVVVEAYEQVFWERFELGSVAHPSGFANRAFTSAMIPGSEGVRFRVKVTDTEKRPGVLLAEAGAIRPRAPGEKPTSRRFLLDVCQGDIGEQVYQLVCSEECNWPRLVINNKLPNWREAVTTRWFKSLVFPAVIQQVATVLFFSGEMSRDVADTDGERWQDLWIAFLCGLTNEKIPEIVANSDACSETLEWIDSVVAGFAEKERLLRHYMANEE